MNNVGIRALLAVLVTQTLAAEVVVRKTSYSDAVILFADKALLQPGVELILHSGHKVRGKLLDVSLDQLSFDSRQQVAVCDVQSVRVLGATARPRRIARGITLGILGGLILAGQVVFRVEATPPVVPLAAFFGLPFLGGWTGARIAEHGQDMLYLLQTEGPDALCGPTNKRGGPQAAPPHTQAMEEDPPTTPLPPQSRL